MSIGFKSTWLAPTISHTALVLPRFLFWPLCFCSPLPFVASVFSCPPRFYESVFAGCKDCTVLFQSGVSNQRGHLSTSFVIRKSLIPYRIIHLDRAHNFLAVRAGEPDREALIEGPLVLVVVVVFVVVVCEMAQGDEIETMRAGFGRSDMF